MSYTVQNPVTKTVTKTLTENYTTSSLDITSFTFVASSKTIAFEVRYNNPNGGEDTIEAYQVPIEEFDTLVGSNVQVFRDVRKACFDWLIGKGVISEGMDVFP